MSEVKRYRKRPIIVEAMGPIDILNRAAIAEWCNGFLSLLDSKPIIVPTLEGDMYASLGDYVIRGVAGEFYPCKPNIFTETYDEERA